MSVYKHYNQEQLNDQYNTRLQVPEYADYFDRWEKLSRQTELNNTIFKDISFGTNPEERLDIFPSTIPHSKTLIFIHGGYWHLLDKTMFHFLAEHFLQYNVTTVLLNYPLAPQSSLNDIVESCRKAIRWLHGNIVRFNGDPNDLYLMGHSAGGHLASMILVEEEAKLVKAAISLSGLFRLEPIALSYLNKSIGLDLETTLKSSPIFLNPSDDFPILLAVGKEESNEFKAQTEELYYNWKNKCSDVEFLEVPGKNHYSILDAAVEKNSKLWDAMIRFMNINP